jgi:uncharacterized YigZ family protein
MEVFSYLTIQSPTEGHYKEKGSKFIAFAYPVVSESDIKLHIDFLKKKHFDARHHCFAWRLGTDKNKFRAFDDGEPNHSAGDPILGQIRSKTLTNVLVVVVRYFGGVKLGVGGLINAYRAASEDALNNAIVIEKEVVEKLGITYSYSSTPEIMRMVKEFSLAIVDQDFKNDCALAVEVKLREKKNTLEKIKLLQAMGHEINLSDGEI